MAININLNDVQSVPVVVNSSLTAALNKRYTVVASATFTDPSPVEGKGFIVFVINGTATVGGTGYSTAGTIIYRTYHSGAWSNKVYYDKAYFDTIYQAAGTYLTSANITQTITNGDTTHTPSSDAVKDYADKKVGSAMTQAINEAKGADIASSGTTDIGAATGNYVQVTGTTTITALGTIQAGTRRIVEFTGILILTHNGTSLILPTGANITTAAGDVATFVSLGSGNWKCVNYMRYNGAALFGGLSGTINEIAYFNSSSTIASLTTATYPSLTELSYVKGVTSAVQTQLDAKLNYFQSGLTANYASPADGTVAYNMPLVGGFTWSVSKYTGASFPLVGTINAIQIIGFHSIAATNESVSFYLRNETTGTDYPITTSWDDSYGTSTYKTRLYTGLSIPIGNTTDLWLLKLVNPTWSTNPTNWVFSFGYIIKY